MDIVVLIDQRLNALPGLRRGDHHQSAPGLIYNVLPQHGRASGDCGMEIQQRYLQCSCGSNDTIKKTLPYSPLKEHAAQTCRGTSCNVAETNSASMDRHNYYTSSYGNAISAHRHVRNTECDNTVNGVRSPSSSCCHSNVDNCVHDVIARYMPDAATSARACYRGQYQREQESTADDDWLRGERVSVDGHSDDSSTTSGSYVLDAGEQLKEQRYAFDDVFV